VSQHDCQRLIEIDNHAPTSANAKAPSTSLRALQITQKDRVPHLKQSHRLRWGVTTPAPYFFVALNEFFTGCPSPFSNSFTSAA